MSHRNTVIRSMHDLGLAAWFGGTLMGAIGLNRAAAAASNPRERLSLSSTGWRQWAPVQAAALAVHGIGGAGLIFANKSRLLTQPESRANTIVKLAITATAVGSTVYAGILGRRIARHAAEGAPGVTEPSSDTSPELASAQKQEKFVQWINPALAAVLIVLGAQQGEQQRPVAGLLGTRVSALLGR